MSTQNVLLPSNYIQINRSLRRSPLESRPLDVVDRSHDVSVVLDKKR